MLRLIGTYAIPEWAICYLANGDRDNLSDDEVAEIEEFTDSILNSDTDIRHITWDFDVMDEDKYGGYYMNEINSNPAIGHLACKTYDIPCWVEYDGEDVEQKEYDILVTSDIYGANKMSLFRHKKFVDAEEAETWVNTYFKHYGYSMDYKIYQSSDNTITISDDAYNRRNQAEG